MSAEEIWNEACKQTLKTISNEFLNKDNQAMAKRLGDVEVFQAIGETITNFPIPPYAASQSTSVSTKANGEAEGVEVRCYGYDEYVEKIELLMGEYEGQELSNAIASEIIEPLKIGVQEYWRSLQEKHEDLKKLLKENDELKASTPKEAHQVAVECYVEDEPEHCLILCDATVNGWVFKAFLKKTTLYTTK